MRVNVYTETNDHRIEIVSKDIDGHTFTGLRFYLELPATVNGVQYQGHSCIGPEMTTVLLSHSGARRICETFYGLP
jgi:hypothetical protein